MARAFVRVGLCIGLASCFGLWSFGAAAQTADVVEDESETEDKADSQDQASDKEDESKDDGDGDWGGEGGGAASGSGFHFGLRLAYGFPMGKPAGAAASSSSSGGGTGGATATSTSSTGSGDMSDITRGQIPIWVDLGWQFTPSFMAGAYFSYGFVLPSSDLSDACDAAKASCRLSDIRLGLQAQLSFSPGRSVDPWVGVGAGYEWFTINVEDSMFRYHGWEMLMLQGGVDFGGDTGGSTIGPFAAFTFGQFSRAKVEFGSISDSADIDETAMHNWLFIGVRGVVK